jgi:hypothetical protein
MLRRGEVQSYAELARLTHVSRSRLSQVMGLLDLAPAIQEAILSLPPVTAGGDPVSERAVRAIVARAEWSEQRRLFRASR